AKLSATQAERERLAAELHDNLAQTLSFLNFKTDRLEAAIGVGDAQSAAQVLAEMRGATTRAYAQVRAALTGLHTAPATQTALANDLRACIAEVQAATGMTIALTIDHPDALTVTPLARQQALHIVREALTNVWRHAGARQVIVCAERNGEAVRIIVHDDGRGFDPTDVDASAHMGLAIMRARAERSGGALSVQSQPGAGATIVATFPVVKERSNEPLATVAG
ncbi:MAG: sensor histidine kinase, partial [Caldilinea sp.]